jgi:CRISPR/Cas system CSM-associated protein Csm4 (group 5 of RAMP superfamily)
LQLSAYLLPLIIPNFFVKEKIRTSSFFYIGEETKLPKPLNHHYDLITSNEKSNKAIPDFKGINP